MTTLLKPNFGRAPAPTLSLEELRGFVGNVKKKFSVWFPAHQSTEKDQWHPAGSLVDIREGNQDTLLVFSDIHTGVPVSNLGRVKHQ